MFCTCVFLVGVSPYWRSLLELGAPSLYRYEIYMYTNATFSYAATIQSTMRHNVSRSGLFATHIVRRVYTGTRLWSVALKCCDTPNQRAAARSETCRFFSPSVVVSEYLPLNRFRGRFSVKRNALATRWFLNDVVRRREMCRRCSSRDGRFRVTRLKRIEIDGRAMPFPSGRIHPRFREAPWRSRARKGLCSGSSAAPRSPFVLKR